MPRTEVLFFKGPSGQAPLVDWLRMLEQEDRQAFAKCAVLQPTTFEAVSTSFVRALERKHAFAANPELHTYREEN